MKKEASKMLITVVFVGDEGVGKTSLVQRVVGDYDESKDIPTVLSPIRLTKCDIMVDLVDTSSKLPPSF